MTKLFYDCEFHEDGKTIDLISIGMVCEDGHEYYAVSNEFDTRRVAANDWLMNNVMTSIDHEEFALYDFRGPYVVDINITDPAAKSRGEIAYDLYSFIARTPNPELWAWYGAYDHVCLAQLFGRMIDLPSGIPMFTNDLKTLVQLAGNPRLSEQGEGLHNALDDARMNLVRYKELEGYLNGN